MTKETEASPAPDIIKKLNSIRRCQRCGCASCENGYENHSHRCTQGPHCVQTRETLANRQISWAIIAAHAVCEIRKLRDENDALRARVTLLEAIHHG